MSDEKDKKYVIIYDTGQTYMTPEEDIYDPPDDPPRKNNKDHNEEELDN